MHLNKKASLYMSHMLDLRYFVPWLQLSHLCKANLFQICGTLVALNQSVTRPTSRWSPNADDQLELNMRKTVEEARIANASLIGLTSLLRLQIHGNIQTFALALTLDFALQFSVHYFIDWSPTVFLGHFRRLIWRPQHLGRKLV